MRRAGPGDATAGQRVRGMDAAPGSGPGTVEDTRQLAPRRATAPPPDSPPGRLRPAAPGLCDERPPLRFGPPRENGLARRMPAAFYAIGTGSSIPNRDPRHLFLPNRRSRVHLPPPTVGIFDEISPVYPGTPGRGDPGTQGGCPLQTATRVHPGSQPGHRGANRAPRRAPPWVPAARRAPRPPRRNQSSSPRPRLPMNGLEQEGGRRQSMRWPPVGKVNKERAPAGRSGLSSCPASGRGRQAPMVRERQEIVSRGRGPNITIVFGSLWKN